MLSLYQLSVGNLSILLCCCLLPMPMVRGDLIDFSIETGQLENGVNYTLSGFWNTSGNEFGVQLEDEFVTIEFDQQVVISVLPAVPETMSTIHNDNTGETTVLIVDRNVFSLSDPELELQAVSGVGGDTVAFRFRYRNNADPGPNGNDFLAVNQNWALTANCVSRLTIFQFGTVGSATLSAYSVEIAVPPLPGDINFDCEVNLLDVPFFVELLIGGGFQTEADINGDGVVNLQDVGPFVDLLSG